MMFKVFKDIPKKLMKNLLGKFLCLQEKALLGKLRKHTFGTEILLGS